MDLGLDIHAGVHTGEVEVRGGSISGLAVHIGARVGAAAQRNEILVTSTVKDLVIGSGLQFVDRGTHTLRGVDREWQLSRPSPTSRRALPAVRPDCLQVVHARPFIDPVLRQTPFDIALDEPERAPRS
ncbi:MAG: hypothetical protein M3N68_03490 [Actinomycetota bacterium]|nr:hypothetical protein [Actinomycetota bacterium]